MHAWFCFVCVCVHAHALQKVESAFASFDLALKLEGIGVSLICDGLGEELCFISLLRAAAGMQQRGDKQKVVLRIQRMQIDNQLESSSKPVVFTNRGGRGLPSHDPQVRPTRCMYTPTLHAHRL